MSPISQDRPKRLALSCADGAALRAELLTPDERRTPPAVVCHPHPLHGGTMYNHVVSTLWRAFAAAGSDSLRFNFRGTSGSTGSHGRGVDERLDVEAALDLLSGTEAELGDRPTRPEAGVVVAGYSFGADVGLSVDRDDVAGWLAIAPTLGLLAADRYRAARSTRPTVIVVGDHDEFCPPDHARRLTADWKATTVIVLAGERHQMATAQAALTDQVAAFLPQVTGGLPG